MTDWTSDIKRQNENFAKHFKDRDFTALSNLYTVDSVTMPPGAKSGIGREVPKTVFSSFPGLGVDNVTLTTEKVIPHENGTAIEIGKALSCKADGTIVDHVKYVVVWKRVDGEAKMHIDIWNSDGSS